MSACAHQGLLDAPKLIRITGAARPRSAAV